VKRAAGVALFGAVLMLSALTFNSAPLFVPGVAFLVLGTCIPAWIYLCARGARVSRELAVDRTIEEEPVTASLWVSRGRLGLPGAEVLDPLGGRAISLSRPLSLLNGRREARVIVTAQFHRRGVHRLNPPAVVVRDPLGLAGVTVSGRSGITQILVLPRTEPVRWSGSGRGSRMRRTDPGAAAEPFAAVDLDGLRPYRTGTPASRIHWPAVARGAGLIERRLRPDGDTRPLVVLDARGAEEPQHLDAAVRAAASLTLELGRTCGCRLLLPGERRSRSIEPDLIAWPTAHARLAMIQDEPGTPAPKIAAGAHLGVVLYVAASRERLRTASGGPGAKTVLVLPVALLTGGLPSGSFEVSGCRGFPARSLAGLRREQEWAA
jgi:uncharacterized protein (DUF58 family)